MSRWEHMGKVQVIESADRKAKGISESHESITQRKPVGEQNRLHKNKVKIQKHIKNVYSYVKGMFSLHLMKKKTLSDGLVPFSNLIEH